MTNHMLELQIRSQTALVSFAERAAARLETLRDEDGQTSVEYLGIIVVVVAIIGVLYAAAGTIGKALVDGITTEIGKLT